MRQVILALAGMAVVGIALLAVLPATSASAAPTSTAPGPEFRSNITAGFNSFNIPAGNTIWFSAVMTLTGPAPTSNLTIGFVDQKLTFSEPGGVTFVRSLPKSVVAFSMTAITATTVWNLAKSEWITTVPVNYHDGNVFLSGFAYYVGAAGVPGSTHVDWSRQFVSPECLFRLNWQWGAAVFTRFADPPSHPNYGLVGVKPVDDNLLSVYKNSDHAGTPENFRANLA